MMSSTGLNYNQAYASPSNLKCNFREYSILNAPLWSISRRMKCLCHSNILQSRGTQESSLRGQRLRWLQLFRVEQRKAHVMKLSSTPFWIMGPGEQRVKVFQFIFGSQPFLPTLGLSLGLPNILPPSLRPHRWF